VIGNSGPFGVYEGAFASRVIGRNLEALAPFASGLSGPGTWRAGDGGLLQGRFGWGNPDTGLVLNIPSTPADALGVVIPLQSVNGANGGVVGGPAAFGGPQARWTWQTWDKAARAWRLRAGLVVTLMSSGNFWLRFPSGASYGSRVYASPTDGSALSGPVGGAVQTPWFVCSEAGPGNLAMVSSSALFGG